MPSARRDELWTTTELRLILGYVGRRERSEGRRGVRITAGVGHRFAQSVYGLLPDWKLLIVVAERTDCIRIFGLWGGRICPAPDGLFARRFLIDLSCSGTQGVRKVLPAPVRPCLSSTIFASQSRS